MFVLDVEMAGTGRGFIRSYICNGGGEGGFGRIVFGSEQAVHGGGCLGGCDCFLGWGGLVTAGQDGAGSAGVLFSYGIRAACGSFLVAGVGDKCVVNRGSKVGTCCDVHVNVDVENSMSPPGYDDPLDLWVALGFGVDCKGHNRH